MASTGTILSFSDSTEQNDSWDGGGGGGGGGDDDDDDNGNNNNNNNNNNSSASQGIHILVSSTKFYYRAH